MGRRKRGTIDLRIRHCRLTDAQRAMVEHEVRAGWMPKWVRRCVYQNVIRTVGWDECLATGWLLVVRAASIWRPDLGAKFRSFAMNAIKRFLPETLLRKTVSRSVWVTMPQIADADGDADQLSDLIADGRSTHVSPLLSLWCDPDYAAQRRRLHWRDRVVLYLRFVERLGLREVAETLGGSKERIRQIELRGVGALKQARLQGEIRRQLAGGAQ